MAKIYSLKFGSGDPRPYTGMTPTFLIFVRLADGQTIAPPSIAESLTSSGIYQFTYGTTQAIAFLADAATLSPGTVGRYVTGQIDPSDRADEYGTTLVAIGISNIALGISNIATGISLTARGSTLFSLGTSAIAQGVTEIALGNAILANVGIGLTLNVAIGSTASSFGNISQDPVDLFGYLKRISELIQGQESYIKGSGVLTMLDRTGGTTFVQRTVSNSASMVLKG